ncbi:MAG TPA: OmpA family protein, partial [Labilithrix sp.]|nr:OmpA family protein [Labilithrix sp.]
RAPTRRHRARSVPEASASLDDLRRLVLGPERARLDGLEARPTPSPETVGAVLPEAIVRCTEERGRELGIALEPAFTAAVRKIARRDADLLGEILTPTIGAAVRKAVADSLSAMLDRFNAALEQSLSIRSIRWRLEARRTGRPFAEVVLLHTLVFRVEQVFLIHPTTGLVLEHLTADSTQARNPDQVSAMLEAIDSFVREALGPQPSAIHLSRIQLGDVTVWVDRDALLAVAAIVRGTAPPDLGETLRDVRERLGLSHREELMRFHSDPAPFASACPVLEECFRSGRRPPSRAGSAIVAVSAAVGLAVAAGLFGSARARAANEAGLVDAYAQTLGNVPGIVVDAVSPSSAGVQIRGLRDPAAADPAEVIAQSGLPPAELRFRPFLSLDPPTVEARAVRVLRPPPGVTVEIRDGVLRVNGVAHAAWIERARRLAPALAGVTSYDDQELRSQSALDALRAASERLETTELPFAVGSWAVSSPSLLDRALANAKEVMILAPAARHSACIVVVGHADSTGANQTELSEARAATVASWLRDRGVPEDNLRTVGAGVWHDAGTDARARSVTFRVELGRPFAGCEVPP